MMFDFISNLFVFNTHLVRLILLIIITMKLVTFELKLFDMF